MVIKSKWFYGHEVSPYGQENGYVDYRTLAQAFDAASKSKSKNLSIPATGAMHTR